MMNRTTIIVLGLNGLVSLCLAERNESDVKLLPTFTYEPTNQSVKDASAHYGRRSKAYIL